jgi:hypothetical protein
MEEKKSLWLFNHHYDDNEIYHASQTQTRISIAFYFGHNNY